MFYSHEIVRNKIEKFLIWQDFVPRCLASFCKSPGYIQFWGRTFPMRFISRWIFSVCCHCTFTIKRRDENGTRTGRERDRRDIWKFFRGPANLWCLFSRISGVHRVFWVSDPSHACGCDEGRGRMRISRNREQWLAYFSFTGVCHCHTKGFANANLRRKEICQRFGFINSDFVCKWRDFFCYWEHGMRASLLWFSCMLKY